MKIAFVVPSFFAAGRIFAEDDPLANRDDCLRPFIELQRALEQHGVTLATADQLPVETADAVLCLNMPGAADPMWAVATQRQLPVHVIALESEYIDTRNADVTLLSRCTTVFTSRDDVIDGVKFLPVRFAQTLRPPLRAPWSRRKFACMVSGNKASSHPDELYSRRLDVIRWYDAHYPALFDLFGTGWTAPAPSNLAMRAARRLPLLRSLLAPKFKVFRGTIDKKLETLSSYRFCFCYENFSSPDGWITEKIFDAMFAGCVPVYWGPSNTQHHIPAACYIDASALPDPDAVHTYLTALDDAQCAAIVTAIDRYLKSEQATEFSVATFVTTVAQRLRGAPGKTS
jgi:hypothetical protein